MSTDAAAVANEQAEVLAQLAQSRAKIQMRAQAGQIEEAVLRQIANDEADLALALYPAPIDPAEHVRAAHAYARRYLERLPQHDPARIVIADEAHSYTPRKILRRVLDHALDHLNQIDQWLAWMERGVQPTPTDGWADSGVTLPEDVQPLSPRELQAWLWRIDLAVGMVVQRAQQLSESQLNWKAPDEGWTLRRMLHHLASAEVYYAVWLDEPLPDDPLARYSEASQRFERRLRQFFAQPAREGMALLEREHFTVTTVEDIVRQVLVLEQGV